MRSDLSIINNPPYFSIPRVFGHLRNSQFSHISPCQCGEDADQRNATSNPPVCFVYLQWIKRSPKIHPQKLKEKWAKEAGEKENLDFYFLGPGSLTTILFLAV